jgi:hypothetical protein
VTFVLNATFAQKIHSLELIPRHSVVFKCSIESDPHGCHASEMDWFASLAGVQVGGGFEEESLANKELVQECTAQESPTGIGKGPFVCVIATPMFHVWNPSRHVRMHGGVKELLFDSLQVGPEKLGQMFLIRTKRTDLTLDIGHTTSVGSKNQGS